MTTQTRVVHASSEQRLQIKLQLREFENDIGSPSYAEKRSIDEVDPKDSSTLVARVIIRKKLGCEHVQKPMKIRMDITIIHCATIYVKSGLLRSFIQTPRCFACIICIKETGQQA